MPGIAELVHGAYAKSKAAANKKVLLAAEKGLDAGIVYPSGIIGPEVQGHGKHAMRDAALLPPRQGCPPGFAVGTTSLMCGTRPLARELRGQRAARRGLYTLRALCLRQRVFDLGGKALRQEMPPFLPRRLAGLAAPIFERRSIRRGEKPFFTPYSISVLGSNGNFSHKKASEKKHLTSSAIRRVTCQIRYRCPALAILVAYIKRAASAAQHYHISPLAMASHSLSGHTMGVAASCGREIPPCARPRRGALRCSCRKYALSTTSAKPHKPHGFP